GGGGGARGGVGAAGPPAGVPVVRLAPGGAGGAGGSGVVARGRGRGIRGPVRPVPGPATRPGPARRLRPRGHRRARGLAAFPPVGPVTKTQAPSRGAAPEYELWSDRADVLGLRTLRPLGDLELDPLVLVEAPVATHRDRGEVGEHVVTATVRRDEPVPLLSVEPFDRTLHHSCLLAVPHNNETPRERVPRALPKSLGTSLAISP